VGSNLRLALAVAISCVAFILSPAAAADPESPSYEAGQQIIDDAARQGPLHVTDLSAYCHTLLGWATKSGEIARVEAPEDFLAGCQGGMIRTCG